MKRTLYAVPAMLCLTAAIVTAQAPAGDKPALRPINRRLNNPPRLQHHRRASASAATNKVTYTGCVKPGTAAGRWILENAEAAAEAWRGAQHGRNVGNVEDDSESQSGRERRPEAARQSQGRSRPERCRLPSQVLTPRRRVRLALLVSSSAWIQ